MKSWKKVLSACLAVLMLTGCSAAPGSSASDTGKENSSASGTESSAADDGWTLAATDPWAAYPETITYTVGKTARRMQAIPVWTERNMKVTTKKTIFVPVFTRSI